MVAPRLQVRLLDKGDRTPILDIDVDLVGSSGPARLRSDAFGHVRLADPGRYQVRFVSGARPFAPTTFEIHAPLTTVLVETRGSIRVVFSDPSSRVRVKLVPASALEVAMQAGRGTVDSWYASIGAGTAGQIADSLGLEWPGLPGRSEWRVVADAADVALLEVSPRHEWWAGIRDPGGGLRNALVTDRPCTASSALSVEPGATRVVTIHSGEGGSVRCVLGRLAPCASIGIFVRRRREAGVDNLLSTWERSAAFLGASAGREAIDFGRLIPASYRIDCFGVTGNRIILGAGRCEVALGQRSEVGFDACTGAWDVDIDLPEDIECRWLIAVTGGERGMEKSKGTFAGTSRFEKGVLEIRGMNAPTALVHLTASDGVDRTIKVDARSRRRY